MNLARIRVWTAGSYVVSNAVTTARRAQAAGVRAIGKPFHARSIDVCLLDENLSRHALQ